MTMPEHISLESAKTMLCALTGQFAYQTWTAGPTHNNVIKKLPASRYSVTGDIDADPSSPSYQYSEYPKLVLVLTCR